MLKTLPKEALDKIDKYFHLPLGSKLVQCPYFKNKQGVRSGLRVFMGKGSPEEIIEEVNIFAKRNKIELNNLHPLEIRKLMLNWNLGVDCSGFILNILKVVDEKKIKEIAIQGFSKYSWLRRIISFNRPIENISANLLTSPPHSQKLNNWQDIKPGDIIRTRKGKHVLLVTEAKYLETKTTYLPILKEFVYYHSTSYFGDDHGVRRGKVVVIYPNEFLVDQNWEEKDKRGRNYTLEGLMEDDGSNGVYRLKV